tara:strand:+ start:273 stop:569 length:297 start_codon:yes stop_codon:yes gene_type:complete
MKLSEDQICLKLSKVQSKAIIALAKADAKSIKLIIATLLNLGIYWEWCEHDYNNEPTNGWPDEWKEISKELEQELKVLKDEYHKKINSEISQELKTYG